MITILDVLRAREGGTLPESVPGALFDKHGLPMLAGCESCGATLGPWNAAPTRTGFIRCAGAEDEGGGCAGNLGFATVAEFEAFEKGDDPREAARADAAEREIERLRDVLEVVKRDYDMLLESRRNVAEDRRRATARANRLAEALREISQSTLLQFRDIAAAALAGEEKQAEFDAFEKGDDPREAAIAECERGGGCGFSPCLAGQPYDAEAQVKKMRAVLVRIDESVGFLPLDIKAEVREALK